MPLYELSGVRPVLGPGAFVAPSAAVIGNVTLGEVASIWFGTVVRGDVMPIRVGARTNIQDNSTIHVTGGKFPTSVGDDVTVGHMVLLHGCTVGHRCLIGMGSILLDGAVVGDDSLIAAGSLLTPGTLIPPGMMALGRPARVLRPLTDADRKWIRDAGAVYAQLASQYAGGALRPVS